MSGIKLTHQMKRHAIIVALNLQHNDTEIAYFLKVARSFMTKVQKELEASGRDPVAVSKCKTHIKGLNTIRTNNFIWKIHKIIGKIPGKLIRTIEKDLKVSKFTIRIIVNEEFW